MTHFLNIFRQVRSKSKDWEAFGTKKSGILRHVTSLIHMSFSMTVQGKNDMSIPVTA